MLKIATHNSGTGEPCSNFLSWLLTPFARCQSKTIKEQLEAGCTYFDLRVDKDLRLSHGPWHSKTTLNDALYYLNRAGLLMATESRDEKIYLQITYEYSLKTAEEEQEFVKKILEKVKEYYYIDLICINVKKPSWKQIYSSGHWVTYEGAFVNLDGRSWHTYLPIPWLWDKIYYQPHGFNDMTYKMTDFL